MKKTVLSCMLSALVLVFVTGSAFAAESFISKTELIQNNAEKTQPGYVVFSGPSNEEGEPVLAIINTEGEVVHTVDVPYVTSVQYAYMLENGNFLLEGSEPGRPGRGSSNPIVGGGPGSTIMEITWEGNVVWQFEFHDADYNWMQHHDMRKIWNKALGEYTYIFLGWEHFTGQDALKLGFNPATGAGQREDGIWSPCQVYEANQNGEIIWRWSFADHLMTTFADNAATQPFVSDGPLARTITPPAVGHPSDYPGKLNVNTTHGSPGTVGPTQDWTHCNSLDYNSETGDIVLNSKHMSEIYVIDHDNTFVSNTNWKENWNAAASDAGDFKYRFGNPAQYATDEELKAAEPAYQYPGYHQFWAAHNIHWIGRDYYPGWGTLEGDGNFIIFDNNTWNPMENQSRIIEWNPYLDAAGNDTGNYVDPAIAGYNGGIVKYGNYNISNQVQWIFKSTNSSFYSSYISGAQRMPNGNTFITSGGKGHFFEVTPENEVVWEYTSPVTGGEIVESIGDSDSLSVFRAYKIPAGYPGLAGKTLVPQGTLTNPESYSGFGFGGGIGGSGGGGGAGGGAGGGGGY